MSNQTLAEVVKGSALTSEEAHEFYGEDWWDAGCLAEAQKCKTAAAVMAWVVSLKEEVSLRDSPGALYHAGFWAGVETVFTWLEYQAREAGLLPEEAKGE